MAGKKEIIMNTALKLLEQRSYREISVLDIVAESNVNRNTFYYHFKDMAALMEAIACRSIDRVFANKHTDLEGKLMELVDVFYDNRVSALHVYGSADKSVFDRGLDNVCCYILRKVFECCPEYLQLPEAEQLRRFRVGKCCCYGVLSDWLLKGIDEGGREELYTFCRECMPYLK